MPGPALASIICSGFLAALQRITPQIIAVQLDKVEGIEEDGLVSPVVTDEIERGNAIVIARNRFSIDNAGARAQAARKYPATKQNTSATKAPTLEVVHTSDVLDDATPGVIPDVDAEGKMRFGLRGQVRLDSPASRPILRRPTARHIGAMTPGALFAYIAGNCAVSVVCASRLLGKFHFSLRKICVAVL
jgi:hypothetical protein